METQGGTREKRAAQGANTLESDNTPTPSNGDAGSADPIDRIQAWLDADSGGGDNPEPGQPDPKASSQPTDKPTDGASDGKDEPQFTTSHLARYLGMDETAVDVDEEGQPLFRLKIDGKEETRKFADLIETYQKAGHAETRMREAAEKDRAAERKLQEAEQAVTAKLNEQQQAIQQVAQLALVMNQDLMQERASINWDALWAENPAQARALERRFEERQHKINASMQQLAARNAQIKQQAEAKQRELSEKNSQQQFKRLLDFVPEWKDPATRTKEATALTQWAIDRGYDEEFLTQVNAGVFPNSAAIVRDLREAWTHATLKQSKPDVENKLRTAPRLVKPGTPTNTNVQDVTVKGLKADFKKSQGKNTKTLQDLLMAKGLA